MGLAWTRVRLVDQEPITSLFGRSLNAPHGIELKTYRAMYKGALGKYFLWHVCAKGKWYYPTSEGVKMAVGSAFRHICGCMAHFIDNEPSGRCIILRLSYADLHCDIALREGYQIRLLAPIYTFSCSCQRLCAAHLLDIRLWLNILLLANGSD